MFFGVAFQRGINIVSQKSIHLDDNRWEMLLLMKTSVKIFALLLPLCRDQALIHCLVHVWQCLWVDHPHGKDSIGAPRLQVSNQQVTLLLRVKHHPQWVVGFVVPSQQLPRATAHRDLCWLGGRCARVWVWENFWQGPWPCYIACCENMWCGHSSYSQLHERFKI